VRWGHRLTRGAKIAVAQMTEVARFYSILVRVVMDRRVGCPRGSRETRAAIGGSRVSASPGGASNVAAPGVAADSPQDLTTGAANPAAA